ncbi:MAG: flavin reductase [Anaerococcus sp.]|nr:flavin reductase [Anaerococcus sp.]
MKFDQIFKGYDVFNRDWALVSAGKLDDFNGCTIGWGSIGTIWNNSSLKPRITFTIYVHPDRYTSKYLRENDYFTLSFFDPKDKKILSYMGSHSGKDEKDKAINAGLTPIKFAKSVGYKEASLSLLLKKLYQGQFEDEGLRQEIKDYYKAKPMAFPDYKGGWQGHYVFVGELMDIIEQ